MLMFRIRHGNSFSRSIAIDHAMTRTIHRSCVSCPGPHEMSGLVVPRHTDKLPHSDFSHIAHRAPSTPRCRAVASVRTRSRAHATWEPVPTDYPGSGIDRRAPLLIPLPRLPHAIFWGRFASDGEAPT